MNRLIGKNLSCLKNSKVNKLYTILKSCMFKSDKEGENNHGKITK